jgi:hypothetical protein
MTLPAEMLLSRRPRVLLEGGIALVRDVLLRGADIMVARCRLKLKKNCRVSEIGMMNREKDIAGLESNRI